MPRARKPNAMKLVAGTQQKCREREEISIEPVAQRPEPPDWLPNDDARQEFARLVDVLFPLGLINKANQSAVAICAGVCGQIMQGFRDREPPTAAMVASYHSLLSAFGATPATASKVTPKGDAKKVNKFAGIGNVP